MSIVTIDFETFWSDEHTLSKMLPMTYVMHEKTQIISCAIKLGRVATLVYVGENEIRGAFESFKHVIEDSMLIGHNMSGFDSMIAAWRFGLKPKMWGCTLAMARPLHASSVGGSLAKLVEHYGVGVKNNAVLLETKGRRLEEFTATEVERMRAYNGSDADQCHAIFQLMRPHFSPSELWHIDATIRQLIEPVFTLNKPLLATTLIAEQARKRDAIRKLADKFEVFGTTEEDIEEEVRSMLASAPKFAAFLTSEGVEVPTKPSPSKPDKLIPALAKTDEAFIALTESDNEAVAAGAMARLAVKSTILETRIQKFNEVSDAVGGNLLPIPINYCGADTTGRDSGWAYNPQNLPRVEPDKPQLSDALRNAIEAPAGHKIVVADLSGIELRVNMFLWKVPYAMALLQADPQADLYKPLASEVLGVPLENMPKMVRQSGKAMHLGCFSADTKVFTSNGAKCIVDVLGTDLVWDGKSWVKHHGLVFQGVKPVITCATVSATSNHKILTEHGWSEWGLVCGDPQSFQSALLSATLPSWNGVVGFTATDVHRSILGSSAPAVGKDTLIDITLNEVSQPGVLPARNKPQHDGLKNIGNILTSCQTTPTAVDCLTDFPQQSEDATGARKAVPTIERAVLQSTTRGERIDRNFFGTLSRFLAGISQNWKWTALITTKGTHQATSVLPTARATCSTDAQLLNYKPELTRSKTNSPVYDLLNCGPDHRFTILTDRGPILVHNCGFGLRSTVKYRAVARQMARVEVTESEADVHILGYRHKHPEIVAGWATCHRALDSIYAGLSVPVDPWGLVHTCKEGLRLPSGRLIRYPGLHKHFADGKWEWVYGRHNTRIYAGKVTENIVQALARDVFKEDKLKVFLATGYRSALDVHDELVYVIPEEQAQAHLDIVQGIMRQPPSWWPELVTWSEGGIADNYGSVR